MDRRHIRPLLAAVCAWACAFVPGCDPVHRQAVRKTQASADDDETKSEQQVMRGLHDSGGSSGGWSRRAREIESHFNVE